MNTINKLPEPAWTKSASKLFGNDPGEAHTDRGQAVNDIEIPLCLHVNLGGKKWFLDATDSEWLDMPPAKEVNGSWLNAFPRHQYGSTESHKGCVEHCWSWYRQLRHSCCKCQCPPMRGLAV